MKKTYYERLGESVFRQTLPNGLRVCVVPKDEYARSYAFFATRYGGMDTRFQLDGKWLDTPAGIAHYLEHKMFDTKEGNALQRLAQNGAEPNAFTSNALTGYYFDSTTHFEENLEILLSFVSIPYFTDESVAKEQGIIGQEIKMYDDSPDWRLLTGLFRCLYPTDPIRDDIAGTVESIAELTPELLYACTDAFYRPDNMVLAVAGNIELEQAVEACRRAGLDKPVTPHTVQLPELSPEGPIVQHELNFTMPLNRPCFALGYREQPIPRGEVKRELLCDMLPSLVCGGLTDLYRKLYDQALVNPEFGGDYVLTRSACAIAFTGESSCPREVAQMVRDEIARLRREGVDSELFTLVKNQMYGELLTVLEGVEDAAGQMAVAFLKGVDLEEQIATLASLTVDDANEALQTMLLPENEAYVEITPQ